MNRTIATFIAGIVFLLLLAPVVAKDQRLQVRWSELASIAVDRPAALVLPDGTMLEGSVTAVHDDSLLFQVRKSSNSSFAKGKSATIPRNSVSVIQLQQDGKLWRSLGTAAGGGAGILTGWAVAEGVFHTSGEGEGVLEEPEGVISMLGLGAGGALIGYFVGRQADRGVTYLQIVP